MVKAFLSHSSENKEFVRAVADDLGRQFCLFDEQVFDTGETFKNSIESHLDASSIFVLFATSNALKRMWVDFEINEAWYRKLEGGLTKALVFLIDSSTQHSELPSWLSRAKVSRTNIPKMVAREIRQHLDELIRSEQHPHFEGRSADIERFQTLMTPVGLPAPHVAAVYGLPNIGRKTFIAKAAQLTFSFNRILPVLISEGDELTDLAIKIATLLEPYSTRLGFEHIVTTIRSSSPEKLKDRIALNLRVAVANKELPVFIDDGGMFTSDGFFRENVKTILNAAELQRDFYVFIISNRKPADLIPALPLRPLLPEHVKRLITKIAAAAEVNLNVTQITELGEYVNGYPPSAYYAVELAKEYGIAALLAEKQRLVQFRTVVFVKYLTDRILNDDQKLILSILARYSPIPMGVLKDAIGCDAASLSASIMVLIDHSLVLPDEAGLYAIAEPLADAVSSAFRQQIDIDHDVIYRSLKGLLAADDAELPRLELYRLLFKASIRSGTSTNDVFHMTSDLIRLAEDFYHRRDYKQCVTVAQLALEELPKSEKARDLLIRGLIQDEQWISAENEIEIHRKNAPTRDIYFLVGFLERKRGRLKQALDAFLEAERLGRSGVTMKREIAMCYFLDDQPTDAKKYISEAMQLKPDRFIVDLSIQIATREGDEATARSGLEKLEVLDSLPFVKHRLSTIELRFGSVASALSAAREAVEAVKDDRPPFGLLSQLATCLTRQGDFSAAEAIIQRMSKQYHNQRSDIRLGLECRLEIERKRYSRALQILENIKNDTFLVYKAMKRDALTGELAIGVLTDELRIKYSKLLDLLNAELASKDVSGSWLTLVR